MKLMRLRSLVLLLAIITIISGFKISDSNDLTTQGFKRIVTKFG
jgi:hypothetical protein